VYRRHEHDQGRPTESADGARDPVRTGTSVQAFLSQTRASCHATADRDCRMSRVSQSPVTRHRTFDGRLPDPVFSRRWKRTGRARHPDQPSGDRVAQYNQRAPCRSKRAMARVCLCRYAASGIVATMPRSWQCRSSRDWITMMLVKSQQEVVLRSPGSA
jgi:hypothetical protein